MLGDVFIHFPFELGTTHQAAMKRRKQKTPHSDHERLSMRLGCIEPRNKFLKVMQGWEGPFGASLSASLFLGFSSLWQEKRERERERERESVCVCVCVCVCVPVGGLGSDRTGLKRP